VTVHRASDESGTEDRHGVRTNGRNSSQLEWHQDGMNTNTQLRISPRKACNLFKQLIKATWLLNSGTAKQVARGQACSYHVCGGTRALLPDVSFRIK
jgi:hypothetical protein